MVCQLRPARFPKRLYLVVLPRYHQPLGRGQLLRRDAMGHIPETVSDLPHNSIFSRPGYGSSPEDCGKRPPHELLNNVFAEEWRVGPGHVWQCIATRVPTVRGIKIQPPVVDLEYLLLEVEEGIDGAIVNVDKENSDMLRVLE
jgi:hypothetical protein